MPTRTHDHHHSSPPPPSEGCYYYPPTPAPTWLSLLSYTEFSHYLTLDAPTLLGTLKEQIAGIPEPFRYSDLFFYSHTVRAYLKGVITTEWLVDPDTEQWDDHRRSFSSKCAVLITDHLPATMKSSVTWPQYTLEVLDKLDELTPTPRAVRSELATNPDCFPRIGEEEVLSEFIPRCQVWITHFLVPPADTTLSVAQLVAELLWMRVNPRVPGHTHDCFARERPDFASIHDVYRWFLQHTVDDIADDYP